MLRAAAVALIVLAFARPFMRQGPVAAAAIGGAREIVIALDQSASMGYGDHWTRAKDAARAVVRGMGANDRATWAPTSDAGSAPGKACGSDGRNGMWALGPQASMTTTAKISTLRMFQ